MMTLRGEVNDADTANLQDGVLRLERPMGESDRPRTMTVTAVARSAPSTASRPIRGVLDAPTA
jgi:hypothetical protein